MLDFFNLFNANSVTREQPGCGSVAGGPCGAAWLDPQTAECVRESRTAV